MKNRFLALCAAIMYTAVVMSGCGQKAAESKPLKESNSVSEDDTAIGEEVSDSYIDSDVIAVVNGEELKSEDIGYYIYNNAVIEMYSIDNNTSADVSAFDWSVTDEEGRPLYDIITEKAIDDAINDTVFRQMAAKTGYSVEAAEKEASELVNSSLSSKGEDSFNLNINMLGIKNVDDYIKVYTDISVFEDIAEDFQSNPNKYIDDISVLSDYIGDKGASVQHILILNDTTKGDALTVAEEVKARAKSGEDFLSLMKEYNEDTGEKENGYTFPEGEMVKSFEEASFGLSIDEISDIVQSDYGYHIIKRICGAYELQNYWRQNADITIASNAAELADFDGVINMIKEARSKELSE